MGTTIVVLYIVVCLQAYLSIEKEREGGYLHIETHGLPVFLVIFIYLESRQTTPTQPNTNSLSVYHSLSVFVINNSI